MTLYSGNRISSQSHDKIKAEISRVITNIIVDNDKIINSIHEMKKVEEWYREARENPDRIPSRILNELIGRLLDSVEPYLNNYLVNTIKVETEVHSDGITLKVIELNFDIKPFVEYVKKVNGTESDKIRITFNIALSGKLDNIRFTSDFRNKEVKVHLDRFAAYLTVSIIKVSLSILNLPTGSLNQPILLYNNQLFRVDDLSFSISM